MRESKKNYWALIEKILSESLHEELKLLADYLERDGLVLPFNGGTIAEAYFGWNLISIMNHFAKNEQYEELEFVIFRAKTLICHLDSVQVRAYLEKMEKNQEDHFYYGVVLVDIFLSICDDIAARNEGIVTRCTKMIDAGGLESVFGAPKIHVSALSALNLAELLKNFNERNEHLVKLYGEQTL